MHSSGGIPQLKKSALLHGKAVGAPIFDPAKRTLEIISILKRGSIMNLQQIETCSSELSKQFEEPSQIKIRCMHSPDEQRN
jgi:hypothetical protein